RLYAFLELVIASLGCTIVFGRPFLGEGLRPLFQALWNYQSFRRTVLLPALNQWIFDVDHASPQSALHEVVCLSSAGTAAGVRRCVADLLWLLRYCGRLHSRVRLKRVDIVDISKEVFSLADFYSGPFSSNPLRDPRVTTFVKMAVSFSKAARGSTILLQENRRRRRLPVSVNLYTEEFFSLMN